MTSEMKRVASKIRTQLANSPNRKTFRKGRKTLLEIAIALEIAHKLLDDLADMEMRS